MKFEEEHPQKHATEFIAISGIKLLGGGESVCIWGLSVCVLSVRSHTHIQWPSQYKPGLITSIVGREIVLPLNHFQMVIN